MEYKNFIIIFSILVSRCADGFSIGTCNFPDLEIPLIEKSINDNENFEVSYDFTGGPLTIFPTDDDDNVIKAVVNGNKLKITSSTDFTKLEETIENHNELLEFERHFTVVCNSVESSTLIIRLTIEDVNNHEPTFSLPSYTYNLPKKLSPEVDLTSVLYGDPLIVEDLDFSNKEITLSIVPPSEIFVIESEPIEDDRVFKGLLKVTRYTTINETITLKVTAIDGGDPKKSATTTIQISAPHMLGTCTLDDEGKLEYGFFQNQVKDTETLNLAIKYTGSLSLSTPLDEDTGRSYIDVTLDEANNQIIFKTNENFDHFDYDQRSLQRQPIITVYRSIELDCAGTQKAFTFCLAVEDTNNHDPSFTKSIYTYELSHQLMPQVDLTSLGEPIIVEDLDFSNTMVTFSVDDTAFYVETVFEESTENKRQYKGILRLSSYKNITDPEGISLTITATDDGEPPRSSTASVKLLAVVLV